MIAIVLSRTRHALTHSVFGSSLAGDGMLVRLRSISIVLLGLVTAVGLGLIVFISQLGFPGVFSGPIPGNPSKAGTIHDAVALTRSAGIGSPALGAGSRVGVDRPRHSHSHSQSPGVSAAAAHPDLAGPHKFASNPDTGPNSEVSQPPAVPVSQPAPTPAPVTTVGSAPNPSPAAQAKQHSDTQPKSNGTSQANAKDDTGSKPVAAAVGKATGDQAKGSADQTTSPSKPSESSSGKSSKDQSTAAKAPASPAPAPATVEKDAPAVSDPAAGKEAVDADGSDGSPQ